jgi:hypothetical protein
MIVLFKPICIVPYTETNGSVYGAGWVLKDFLVPTNRDLEIPIFFICVIFVHGIDFLIFEKDFLKAPLQRGLLL